ncbi:hypothetical protein DFH06DRAFT_1342955 [Mycena polygramma]|nr:hypothetical protein DFH06DRAFT_1342955 [Mycena polygramma]
MRVDDRGRVVVETRRITFDGPSTISQSTPRMREPRYAPGTQLLMPPQSETRPQPIPIDATLLRRVHAISDRDEVGTRRGTLELVNMARAEVRAEAAAALMFGEASSSRGVGSRSVPIPVSSSPPSSPDVEIVETRLLPPQPPSPTPMTRGSPRPLVHSLYLHGGRVRQLPPVTRDNLWLTPERPPARVALHEHHKCRICHEVKSHPVSLRCGHSMCYVCVRMALENSWKCPLCRTTVREKPTRQWFEEDTLRKAYPGWCENTSVNYSFKGLQFPKKPRRS